MSLDIVGPIPTATSFMFVTAVVGGTIPFVVILGTGPSNRYTYAEIGGNLSGTVGTFSAKGTLSETIISDTANSGWVGLDSDNFLINSTSPVTLNLTQITSSKTIFSQWPAPDLFLAGVEYQVNDSSGNIVSVNVVQTDGTRVVGKFVFRALPTKLYGNCDASSGKYFDFDSAEDCLELWACSLDSGITGCPAQVVNTVWTNMLDCMIGNDYQYCGTGTYCGNSDCNGPCQAPYDNCTSTSSTTYSCIVDPKKYFQDVKWWKSGVFIGIVSAIGVIILVLIIIIFVKMKHKVDNAQKSD